MITKENDTKMKIKKFPEEYILNELAKEKATYIHKIIELDNLTDP